MLWFWSEGFLMCLRLLVFVSIWWYEDLCLLALELALIPYQKPGSHAKLATHCLLCIAAGSKGSVEHSGIFTPVESSVECTFVVPTRHCISPFKYKLEGVPIPSQEVKLKPFLIWRSILGHGVCFLLLRGVPSRKPVILIMPHI